MARKDKYYGTNVMIYGNILRKIEQLGYKGYHQQFRIVCKAKSMAEANRIVESYGLGKRIFKRDYTSETGNQLEIELVDKYGVIINIGGIIGDNYAGIQDLIEWYFYCRRYYMNLNTQYYKGLPLKLINRKDYKYRKAKDLQLTTLIRTYGYQIVIY